jgi:exopolysaccharide production protein ExoY
MSNHSQPPFSRPMASACDGPAAGTASPDACNALPGWKRFLDLLCCVAALPILAFFTLVMTVIIRLTSPGPVFFRQERVGHQGRRFMCYKFRTMKVRADTAVHQAYLAELIRSGQPMVKMDATNDSRLIAGAWILRASGLDELPQLINILRGEMSLVGPRPCLPYEYEEYLPWQKNRFHAVPGLTGLWQVSGKNRTTFDEMIRLDVRYAQEKTLGLDLWIMLMTLPALVVQILDTRRGRKEQVVVVETPVGAEPAALAATPASRQSSS